MTRMHAFWFVSGPRQRVKESDKAPNCIEAHLHLKKIARKTRVNCVSNEVATNAQKTQQKQACINANGMHYACSLRALHCAVHNVLFVVF